MMLFTSEIFFSLSQNMNIIGNFYNLFVALIKYPANLSLKIAEPEM